MVRFSLGLICGLLSGAVTWWLTADPLTTGIASGLTALCVWLFGGLAAVLIDN